MRVVGLGTLPSAAGAALARVASEGHELVLRPAGLDDGELGRFDLAVVGVGPGDAAVDADARVRRLVEERAATTVVIVVGSASKAATWLELGADAALDADEGDDALATRLGALARLAARLAESPAASGGSSASVPAFLERLAAEFDRAARYKRALSLVVLAAEAPCAPSNALSAFVDQRIRDVDVLGPLPGERVGVLLPETDAAGALRAARRLIDDLADADLPARAGVAAYPSRGTDDATKLIGRAFEALSEAARLGPRRALAFGAPDVVWAREAPDPWSP